MARGSVHRDVSASGIRLRVHEIGEGAPVLLLHDLLMDHTTWDRVAQALQDGFHVLAPDLPGFGESAKPAPGKYPYGVEAFAETVADLYGGLQLGRAAIVGHGLGGAIAMTLAVRHKELVSRLVLIDPACYEPLPSALNAVARLPLIGNLLFKQLWGKGAFEEYFRGLRHSLPDAADASRVAAYYEAFNSPAARGCAFATLRSMQDTRNVEARTTQITTPTLVLWGRSDPVYPASHGPRLAREIRGAGLEVLDAGHCPQEECPTEVARIVAEFLRAERDGPASRGGGPG